MIVHLLRYMLHVVTPLAKRLRAFIRIRLVLTEYRLATKFHQYLNHALEEKLLEFENRIEMAKQRERDARRVLTNLVAWSNQQIANTTKLRGLEDDLDKIVESNKKNLSILHNYRHSVKSRTIAKKVANLG